MKNATKPNLPPYGGAYSAGEGCIRKNKEAMSKLQAVEKNFRNKEKRIRADLEKVRKIWEQLGKRFRWRQSLP